MTPTAVTVPDGVRLVGSDLDGTLLNARMDVGVLARAALPRLLEAGVAFTYVTGMAHWEVLLRARAIENLAGVIAAAQGGTHENGRRTWGHSLVVDAWGQVLGVQPEGAGVVLADLLPQDIAARRAQLPALTHRVL